MIAFTRRGKCNFELIETNARLACCASRQRREMQPLNATEIASGMRAIALRQFLPGNLAGLRASAAADVLISPCGRRCTDVAARKKKGRKQCQGSIGTASGSITRF